MSARMTTGRLGRGVDVRVRAEMRVDPKRAAAVSTIDMRIIG